MIDWSEEVIHNLGIALNEATLLGVEVDVPARTVEVMLRVLTLPETEHASDNSHVLLTLSPVGRIAASLRHGPEDERPETVHPFQIESLSAVVRSFEASEIYGLEFFDGKDGHFEGWANHLSVDWQAGADGLDHTLDLFQEGGESGQRRLLNLRIWFDDMTIYTLAKAVVPINEFTAGGQRWWDALYRGDSRTNSSGIVPMTWGKPTDHEPQA
jgi:hypothetical protein